VPPTTADELRRAFVEFFVERGHTAVESASLIPHDQSLLFTVAGMVPFKPYFVGAEKPPYRRATSVQKCVRAGGKHNDLDDIGRTNRHFSFFEMLGNFSFGDYFKEDAIALGWELLTEAVGFDGDRLWITVHESDDEAEAVWHERVGLPLNRIQRLGKENFWEMGNVGPCGPCSEIHFDCGPAWVLEPRVHGELPPRGRKPDRAAGQERGHRRRARAMADGARRRPDRLRHRGPASRDRRRGVVERQDLRS
jgi:alanyl-tRNA synthetase